MTREIKTGLRTVAVGSGKGGVGKTTIAVGVAYSLHTRGHRVLILDADWGLANVDVHVGADPVFTLLDVIHGRRAIRDAVMPGRDGPDILPATPGAKDLVDMGDARRRLFMQELQAFAASYDFLIIDAAAGIGEEVTTFLQAAPEVLIVFTNEPTSLLGGYGLTKILEKTAEPPELSAVFNMVKSDDEGHALAGRLAETFQAFAGGKLPSAGVVPYDETVRRAIRARTPLLRFAPDSVAARSIVAIADHLLNGKQAQSSR